jgi:protocatechuate 3,4-dioxygenase beta subunit
MRRTPTRRPSTKRRSLLAAIAIASFGRAPASPARPALAPTPSQTEGPFYPRTPPAERDADLTRIAGRAERARGTPLHLSGRVLAGDGRPLAGAQLELWQCDSTGRYHHVGDRGPKDDNFQGYGVATTDADGRYAFVTIRPVPYPGRPPHMHFKVRHPAAAPLTTQLYVAGDDTAGDGVLSGSPRGTRERLSVELSAAGEREPNALAASFDFVLAQA